MSTEQERRALNLVDQALEIESSQRIDWLRKASEGDKFLFSEAVALLDLIPAAEKFIVLGETADATTRGEHPFAWPTPPTGAELTEGSVLGDFRIQQQIGSGGMGVVYRAVQISLNRDVALKVLPSYLRSSTTANVRFRREIEAAAKLHHTNIVSVYASGDEAGTLYYAMELIEGPPLSNVLDHLRSHPIAELQSATPADLPTSANFEHAVDTPDWAIQSLTSHRPTRDPPSAEDSPGLSTQREGDYFDRVALAVADVADALGYAHQHDVVHRDIKPSNLLLSSDGRLHISDFGLARFMQEPGMTRTGECLGTPFYMAPEQVAAKSDSVDGRADIYSLGATLYELLTLQPPFVGESREQILHQITGSEAIPPRRLNKQVPFDLQTICLKAIEKDPANRYHSAAMMGSDLRAYVNRFAISARRASWILRASKWARRHRALASSLVLATALALAALFFAVTAHRSQSLWTKTQQERCFELAIMAALEGKTNDAQAAVAEAERLRAPSGRLLLLEGQVDMLASSYARAYEHFEKAAAELPNSVAAQAQLARCCIARHFYQRGEEVYQRCQRLQPETLEDYLYLAQVEAFYDAQQATKTLDAAVQRNRASLVARLIRGEVLVGRAHDTADPALAEAALADYRVVAELLGNTALVTSGHMRALLVAASSYEVQGENNKRELALREAELVALRLARLETFRAQQTLAFYHDYLGNTEAAIIEMKKFEKRQVLYLVLTLIREGRFEEANAALDKLDGGPRTDRQLDFFQALIAATSGKPPTKIRDLFPTVGEVRLNPIHELLSVYTISSFVDSKEETHRQCQALAKKQELPAFRKGWLPHLSRFACGEISAEELLSAAGTARKNLCEANYYIALSKLASGDRQAAAEHLQSSIDAGVFNYFEHYLSRALLAQLKRAPQWPDWIVPKQ